VHSLAGVAELEVLAAEGSLEPDDAPTREQAHAQFLAVEGLGDEIVAPASIPLTRSDLSLRLVSMMT
jgi:hypothetical protein